MELWRVYCSTSTACEQVKKQTGTAFKQCAAHCCTTQRCNERVPALMPLQLRAQAQDRLFQLAHLLLEPQLQAKPPHSHHLPP